MLIQAFVPELAVEALDVGILIGLARPDEGQLHVGLIGPGIQHLAIEPTDGMESLNMQMRTIIKPRGHFPTVEAAIKLLWLALRNVLAKSVRSAFDWTRAMNQFAMPFGERFMSARGRGSGSNAQRLRPPSTDRLHLRPSVSSRATSPIRTATPGSMASLRTPTGPFVRTCRTEPACPCSTSTTSPHSLQSRRPATTIPRLKAPRRTAHARDVELRILLPQQRGTSEWRSALPCQCAFLGENHASPV